VKSDVQSKGAAASPSGTSVPVADAAPPVVEAKEAEAPSAVPSELSADEEGNGLIREDVALQEEMEKWRDRALRLEAEMANFRKRQRRLVEEQIASDRELLLRPFLTVIDDLSRALTNNEIDAESLREGVDMTRQSMLRILDQHGVEPIDAEGAAFDPTLHEAVASVPAENAGVDVDMVIEVIQPGYRMGDRLLRPAQVIVAV
jgi:molecular chaperone GrpE